MITLAAILEAAVKRFIAHNGQGQVGREAMAEILDGCKRLYAGIPSIIQGMNNKRIARDQFRAYHRCLLALTDDLFRCHTVEIRSDIARQAGAEAFQTVQNLQAEHEELYRQHIDPTALLPLHYRQELQVFVQTARAFIADKLAARQVTVDYIHEIDRGLAAPFEAGNLEKLCFHHRHYLSEFLRQLLILVTQKEGKDWNVRLQQLLVNHNFNYMGLYNAWERINDRLFAQIDTLSQQERFLHGLARKLHHFAPLRGMAYAPGVPSLLQHLKKYLKDKREELELERKVALDARGVQAAIVGPAISGAPALPVADNTDEATNVPAFVGKVQQVVLEWLSYEKPKVARMDELADHFNISVSTLRKNYQLKKGDDQDGLKRFIIKATLTQAIKSIMENGYLVSEVADRYGYPSPAAFSNQFRAIFGMSPSAYLKILKNQSSPDA